MIEKKPKKNGDKLRFGRVAVNLDQEEFEFVDKIGRDALFTTGKRLTNNKILRTFVNIMKEIGIDGKGLCSCEELKERILMALGMRKERRRYPRFKKEVKASWRKLDSEAEYDKGETKDISEGGFRIVLEEGKEVGEVLEFTILDPSMPENPIKALGRIAWVRRQGDRGSLEAGIQLTYLSQNDRDRFSKLFYEGVRNKVGEV